MKHQAEQIGQWHQIHLRSANSLHQTDPKPEEAAGFVGYHEQILVFRRRRRCFPPENVHALASMQIHQFLVEDVDHGARYFPETEQLFLRQEIRVVGTVDGQSDAIDGMGGRSPTAKPGSVLDVIDTCPRQLLLF